MQHSCPQPLRTATATAEGSEGDREPHLAADLPRRSFASFDPGCLISPTRYANVQNLKKCRAMNMQIRKECTLGSLNHPEAGVKVFRAVTQKCYCNIVSSVPGLVLQMSSSGFRTSKIRPQGHPPAPSNGLLSLICKEKTRPRSSIQQGHDARNTPRQALHWKKREKWCCASYFVILPLPHPWSAGQKRLLRAAVEA